MRHRLAMAALVAVCALTHEFAGAQGYPSKPVRFIIAQAPGGQNDVQARLIGAKLTEALGQPVIYDNRPGAGGQIAFDLMAQTPPDGYTIGMGSISTFGVIPMMPRKPRYEALKDFAPVILVTTSPYVVVVHPSVPARSVKQLVALARARPGGLSYGSPGTGSGVHLTTELFMMVAGIKMVHVPYKGGAPATMDLLAGQLDVIFNNPTTSVPHVGTGRLRALAVTTARRSPALPEVPTVAESGYPGFESGSWQGIVTRAGTPAAVIARLNTEFARILTLPDVKSFNVNIGNEIVGGSPEEFTAFIRAELDKWGKVIKVTGVRND
jgi:tripartite-type tricarboxylate transporter receptor subunit TctC